MVLSYFLIISYLLYYNVTANTLIHIGQHYKLLREAHSYRKESVHLT